jgi:low affinity Fe/Cu permease
MSFDRFAERVTQYVTRPWFFWMVFGAMVAWIPTLFLLDPNLSDLIIDAISNTLSLVLLILLQNSQLRFQKAQDSRQDLAERSLALLLRSVARQEENAQLRNALLISSDALVRNAEKNRLMEEGEA